MNSGECTVVLLLAIFPNHTALQITSTPIQYQWLINNCDSKTDTVVGRYLFT